ncbi:MAG: hypothetical protein ABS28_00285 [Cryomorphaceae bacterium BACL22 MAG-120619-bin32]|nr:MAG: hypothetical protein ABS28_00285 [Cryomorphaceae bacterium BACL22 MAG-120619-bin32]
MLSIIFKKYQFQGTNVQYLWMKIIEKHHFKVVIFQLNSRFFVNYLKFIENYSEIQIFLYFAD